MVMNEYESAITVGARSTSTLARDVVALAGAPWVTMAILKDSPIDSPIVSPAGKLLSQSRNRFSHSTSSSRKSGRSQSAKLTPTLPCAAPARSPRRCAASEADEHAHNAVAQAFGPVGEVLEMQLLVTAVGRGLQGTTHFRHQREDQSDEHILPIMPVARLA